MGFSGLISRSITTPNQGTRGGRTIQYFVIHHMATTNGDWTENAMHTGSKEVSANYIQRSNGDLIGVVPEELRSWSLSSAEWDGKSVTVETENLSTTGWTISDAAYHKLALLAVDLHQRYGLPLDRNHIIGHREVYTRFGASYATACPGGINLDRVVDLARSMVNQAPLPAANVCTSTPASVSSAPAGVIAQTSTTDDGIPGEIFWMRMQLWGQRYGGYTGPLDGVMGVNSWAAVQRILARESGYTGPADGDPGVNTYKAIQRWASRYGYTGPIDGVPGPNTWRAIAKALNTL